MMFVIWYIMLRNCLRSTYLLLIAFNRLTVFVMMAQESLCNLRVEFQSSDNMWFAMSWEISTPKTVLVLSQKL